MEGAGGKTSKGDGFDIDDALDGIARKGADKVVASGLEGWWQRRSENERIATALIAFGLALGPLGQGFLGAVGALFKDAVPTAQQLEAVYWLMLMAAPLAVFCLIVASLMGKYGSVLGIAGLAAAAAVVVSAGLSNSELPQSLANVYCYAGLDEGGIVYERQCRAFDHAGFVAENQSRANPSGALAVFGSAVVYTADSRGAVMAFAAIIVAAGIGLLIREHT